MEEGSIDALQAQLDNLADKTDPLLTTDNTDKFSDEEGDRIENSVKLQADSDRTPHELLPPEKNETHSNISQSIVSSENVYHPVKQGHGVPRAQICINAWRWQNQHRKKSSSCYIRYKRAKNTLMAWNSVRAQKRKREHQETNGEPYLTTRYVIKGRVICQNALCAVVKCS